MWENDGTANRFHSPNQVQVEYLCDVADQSQSWVPASVRLQQRPMPIRGQRSVSSTAQGMLVVTPVRGDLVKNAGLFLIVGQF